MDNARIADLFAQLAVEFATKAVEPPSKPVEPPVEPQPAASGSVTMPKTGHILPTPIAEQTSFWGYTFAAAKSLGNAPPSPMGSSAMFNEYAKAHGLDPSSLMDRRDLWPEIYDRGIAWDAYATPEERKQRQQDESAARRQWDDHWAEKERQNQPRPPVGEVDVPIEQ